MKFSDINFRNFIATFVVVFGMTAIVFVPLSDLVIGILSGYIVAVVQFLYGSSKGSEAKDKTISDMSKNVSADAPDIGGGGIKNPPPTNP